MWRLQLYDRFGLQVFELYGPLRGLFIARLSAGGISFYALYTRVPVIGKSQSIRIEGWTP